MQCATASRLSHLQLKQHKIYKNTYLPIRERENVCVKTNQLITGRLPFHVSHVLLQLLAYLGQKITDVSQFSYIIFVVSIVFFICHSFTIQNFEETKIIFQKQIIVKY